MSNPFAVPAVTIAGQTVSLFGGVGNQGYVVASSTDTQYLDLFVGIPQSTNASAASLNGTYYVASLEFTSGSLANTRNSFFTMTANGSGGIGAFTANGAAQALSNKATSQSVSGASYTMTANGSGTLVFPASSSSTPLISGTKTLYVSPDGSFFISGTAYDMQIGVKALTGNAVSALQGLYFYGGLENYEVGSSSDGLYGTGGSYNELASSSLELFHQRTNPDGFFNQGIGNYDFTEDDSFTINGDGTITGNNFALGAGGNVMIQCGGNVNGNDTAGDYYLQVWLKIPTYSGGGVFLSPVGVVNGANNVPFTAQLAPGEIVSLYGTNLSSQTTSAQTLPIPTTLGGVTVSVAGTQVPVLSVSPTIVSVILPFTLSTNGSQVPVVVTNNGVQSNTVMSYTGLTQPGIFTYPTPGGVGNGAIVNGNVIVTDSAPAHIGDTVSIYMTGLGTVNGGTVAGAAAPLNTSATLVNSLLGVYIDGVQANITYQGLSPGQPAGLYQVNVTIPTGVTKGTHVAIEVATTDGDNFQALIPISN